MGILEADPHDATQHRCRITAVQPTSLSVELENGQTLQVHAHTVPACGEPTWVVLLGSASRCAVRSRCAGEAIGVVEGGDAARGSARVPAPLLVREQSCARTEKSTDTAALQTLQPPG